MIIGIGTDLIEIKRIKNAAEKGKGFLERVFTVGEIAYSFQKKDPYPSLAARFAAKEAVMKALGTGFQGISWQDIEVVCDEKGKPIIFLHGGAAEFAGGNGIKQMLITLSHSREFATAFAIAVGKE